MDSVHTDTYRILGSLTQTDSNVINDEIMDVVDENDSDASVRVTFRDKWEMKYTELNILKDDGDFDLSGYAKQENKYNAKLHQIQMKPKEVLTSINPLFHKMSTLFDTQGLKGLLLDNLQCSVDGPYILLDSDSKYDSKCSYNKHCFHEQKIQNETNQVCYIFTFLLFLH